VTIAIRPSGGVGWREFVEMICPTGEAKYFCKGGWTARNSLIRLKKLVFSRSLSAIAVKAADIGQAAAEREGPAIIGAAVVVGPRRTIIVAAAIPRRIWKQIERHDRGHAVAGPIGTGANLGRLREDRAEPALGRQIGGARGHRGDHECENGQHYPARHGQAPD
jgi:hypothetical protein